MFDESKGVERYMSALVIAPHPDDEVLGCGATIKAFTNRGISVNLCIVTQTYSPEWSDNFRIQRSKEIVKSSRILKIEQIFSLDFPTVKLDTIPKKQLIDRLSEVVQEIKPNYIFLPHYGDVNLDHRIVNQASMLALRPHLLPEKHKIMAYETLSETEWGGPHEPFVPRLYINVGHTIQDKVNAMKSYSSELRSGNHPRSIDSILNLAKIRGSQVGYEYAEAFDVLREVQ